MLERLCDPAVPSSRLDQAVKRGRGDTRPHWAGTRGMPPTERSTTKEHQGVGPRLSTHTPDLAGVAVDARVAQPEMWSDDTAAQLLLALAAKPPRWEQPIATGDRPAQPDLSLRPQANQRMTGQADWGVSRAAGAKISSSAQAAGRDGLRNVPRNGPTGPLLLELNHLGYTNQQAKSIRFHHRLAVVRHHAALVALGLSPDQIIQISLKRPQSLEFLSRNGGDKLLQLLSILTLDQVVEVAKNPPGDCSLEQLLLVAKDLMAEPLQLDHEQLTRIARRGHGPALQALQALGPKLMARPYGFERDQLVAIASNHGGCQALRALDWFLPRLVVAPYNLSAEHLLAVARNVGSNQALQAIERLLPQLTDDDGDYQLTRDQVVAIASNRGGKQTLETVEKLLPAIIKEFAHGGFNTSHVVAIARHPEGGKTLEMFTKLVPKLTAPPYNRSIQQLATIASQYGGRAALADLEARYRA